MKIRHFQNSDIPQASKLAKLTWGNFYTQESLELQNLIYNFMVEYYDRNREYSFSAIDNGLKGILLAFKKNNIAGEFQNFKTKINDLKDENEQKTAIDFYNFIEMCGNEVKNTMEETDVILGLFVSIQKGCGRELLNKLVETCKINGIKNIYLWTDTTCDYKYYKKNDFIQEKEFETNINDKNIKTFIYRKEI